MNIIKKTGVFDDVTGLECTSLDCFVGFLTNYEQYMENYAEKGINGIIDYINPYQIEFAYYVAKDVLKENVNHKAVEMAKNVLKYINDIKSVVDDIKVSTDYDEKRLLLIKTAVFIYSENQ